MENTSSKNTYVLVHGAWAAPFAWEMVKNKLAAEGNEVWVIQLPGHGSDNTNPKSLHMESYIKHVSDIIEQAHKKVILVGHSMAGVIIAGVAERLPHLVEKLVFVAAYVPESGQSAYAISLLDKQSLLGASLLVSDDQSEFDIKIEDAINIFCQDAPENIQQLVLQNYRSEPAAPFSDPVVLSEENFGEVAKYYIATLQDHGIGNDLQKQMIAAAGIKNIYELNTGHTPSLSRPNEVSSILIEIGRQ